MALPIPPGGGDDAIADAAHIIQTALTPVFLLTGIGTLLGLFNTRLARVADHIERIDDLLKSETDAGERRDLMVHYTRLQRRVFMLDASVALGGIGGAATCGSVFVLFLGSVRDTGVAGWLIGLFGVALACTIGALFAFLVDSFLAWHGIRAEGPLPRSTRTTRG